MATCTASSIKQKKMGALSRHTLLHMLRRWYTAFLRYSAFACARRLALCPRLTPAAAAAAVEDAAVLLAVLLLLLLPSDLATTCGTVSPGIEQRSKSLLLLPSALSFLTVAAAGAAGLPAAEGSAYTHTTQHNSVGADMD
jgi:hypothetical protein